MMLRLWVLVAAACLAESCDSRSDVQRFSDDFAAAQCQRTFECCSGADAVEVSGAANQDACVAASSPWGVQATQLIAAGLVRFDDAAAKKCLADVKGSCASVFTGARGWLIPCGDVLVGARPNGDVCDDDFVCVSHDCEGQRCVSRAGGTLPICATSDYPDRASLSCLPRPGKGEPCSVETQQCAATLFCQNSICVAQHPDGAACEFPVECTGTCSTTHNGVCRPLYCQGS